MLSIGCKPPCQTVMPIGRFRLVHPGALQWCRGSTEKTGIAGSGVACEGINSSNTRSVIIKDTLSRRMIGDSTSFTIFTEMMSVGVTFFPSKMNALAFLNPHLYHVGLFEDPPGRNSVCLTKNPASFNFIEVIEHHKRPPELIHILCTFKVRILSMISVSPPSILH